MIAENKDVIAEILPSVGAMDRMKWDALAGQGNPFMSHDFLTAMEDSASVGEGTGWAPAPIILRGTDGEPSGALPAYLKSHSQGEYVFDHGWADAFQRAGGRYYPKLVIAAPFTPANGPRLLASDPAAFPALLAAAEAVVEQNGLSSAHALFIEPDQRQFFEDAGWLMRFDTQFHWHNRNYADFDAFLGDLASRKRKAVRKERHAAQQAVTIARLSGPDIRGEHWDAFWEFYQDTGARKWGTPYLTRSAFDLLGERMADRIVLILASLDGEPVAGALNFIGKDALYGRYWGCTVDIPFLHFELCYYQAIEVAIELGLSRVEAGAQGGHKLARGYVPVETVSAHYIPHPAFREAVADYLERERLAVAHENSALGQMIPFRKDGLRSQDI